MLSLAGTPGRYSGQRPALMHGDQRWTFADLDAHSTFWAKWLVSKGVLRDDLVAFSRPNGPEFLALTFGIYKAGATPAPISGKLPAFERDAILHVMQPRLFVAPDQMPERADAQLPDNALSASWKACTSGGSTGTPKVIIDGRPAGFSEGTDFIGIPDGHPVLVPGPLYHNAPFSAAVFALWRGCTIVTMDRFDAEAALELIANERVSWSIMVPTMMHRIMKLPDDVRDGFDLSAWAMVVHTAAAMPPWLKHAWIDWLGPNHIWEVYGATEGLVRCWIGGRDWLQRPGSVGRPVGGATLRILDEAGRECPKGVVGEIFAMPPGGPRSSYRYMGAERRITPDGWESVGDMGRIDEEDWLYLADRKADLIISGGVNIWPAEVEGALLRHPSIRSCAVLAEADEDMGQVVKAVIESDEANLSLDDLRAFLEPWLARAKHPRLLNIQKEPVRDDAGKFRKSRITDA